MLDIESEQGLIHTLFAFEDLYSFRIEQAEDSISLTFDGLKPTNNQSVFGMLSAWAEQSEKYRSGKITKDQYDEWRYNYPKFDIAGKWAQGSSQGFSDAMLDRFKDKLENM